MVIVTGGSRGIGAAITRKLAKLGHHPVAVNYVASKDVAATIVSAIQADGGKAAAIPGGRRQPRPHRSNSYRVEAALGPLAHLVNNAGITGKTTRHRRRRRSTRHGGKAATSSKSQPRTEVTNKEKNCI